MKKQIILISFIISAFGLTKAQSALSAYSISQPDMKGTARYMGMAGAFGALGGDLTSISQNPGGIGVYRSSDIGFSLDLDLQNSTSTDEGRKYDMDQTKFLLNNIGAVLTLKLPTKLCPNLNFGFTYNKGASFNRAYKGNINTLKTSLSNYIAGISNDPVGDGIPLSFDEMSDNPYENPNVPWISALAFNSFVINPELNDLGDVLRWDGLWQDSMTGKDTSGSASFLVQEQGGIDEFNIVLGGNLNDILYWGMNFQILNMNYRLNTYWGENLRNAYYITDEGTGMREDANWNYNGSYTLSGTGFSYQLGFIFKPVQAFRLGFAFHTPTWYGINEQFYGSMGYNSESLSIWNQTNDGIPGYNSYNFRTPWKILASAAGVLGNNLIVSFDYEWANYGKMHFSEPTYYDGYDWYEPYPWSYAAAPPDNIMNWGDPYAYQNSDIATYYQSTNTFKVGLEFKPISSLSIRAGYSYVSSPVKQSVRDNREMVYTSNLTPSYRLDNTTNYITCGLGYRYSHVYIDLAYIYKKMDSTYHGFSPDPANSVMVSPQSKLSLVNNQIVLSAGYRF